MIKANTLLKSIIIGGIFAMPFLVFVVSSTLFFPFISGKNFDFRILTEIIFGAWVILALRDAAYRPKFSWLLIAVASFVAIIGLADLFGVSPFKSLWSNFERMEGFVSLIHLCAYFFVIGSVFNTQKIWNWFWNTTVGVSTIIAIYGLVQLAGKAQIHQSDTRLDASLGNSAYFAVYILIHIFITAFLLARWRGGNFVRAIYGVIILLQVYVLYYSATRGAILGFIGGALLTALLVALFERERKNVRKIAIGVVVGVIVLVGGFLAVKDSDFIRESPVLARFATISLETEGNTRFIIWGMAIEGVKERPILGWGQENFNYVFNKYYDPRLYAQEPWFDRVHNLILDWLIVGGILGLLGFLSMLFFYFYYLWRAREEDTGLSIVDKSILTGLMAGYIFHNLFVFDNLISYIYFFALLGFVHSLVARPHKEGGIMSREIDKKMVTTILVPLVIILTIFSLYFFNVKGIKTGKTIIQGLSPQQQGLTENLRLFERATSYGVVGKQEAIEQLISTTMQIIGAEQVPNDIKIQFVQLAEGKMKELLKERPGDARLELFAANFYMRLGAPDEALVHLELAKEASPRKQHIYFNIGSAYIMKEEFEKAFEAFEYAYNLDTNYYLAITNYAIGAAYVGRVDIVDWLVGYIFEQYDKDKQALIIDDRLIRAYLTLGEHDKIVTLWQEAVKREPQNTQFHLSLSAAYTQVGERAKAIEEINIMIAIDPSLKDQGEQYIRDIEAGKKPQE